MSVDEFPALCVSLNCGYEYFENTSSIILGFSVDEYQLLSITGSGLETPDSIELANVACNDVIVSEAADTITCQLAG